ncbi:MAG: AarF/ABC1/UbiB kinase family protein [Desulfoarculaceae bacterium]|nr:AarF/ABC1/UbiB kinase family protein [Desulfoarculaceae bacterium]
MKIPHLQQTLRGTRRLAEILRVLSKFGFREIIIELGLDTWLPSIKKEEKPGVAAQEATTLSRPVRLRMVLEELGPTFIKLGQLLSTRPDLVPPEWAEEFKQLQDNCPQVPYPEIQKVLTAEFPGRLTLLFSSIEEKALAAASMAQIHRARRVDGSEVVIKILRPGNRQLIEEDMALLEGMAQFVEHYFSNLGYSPVAVAKEFARELSKEVNLIHEGQSTERLRRYFQDDPNISFPKVHWEASTRNILTLEEIHGRLLSTVNPELLEADTCRAIVAIGTDAIFKQCLHFGFFHADPHPGNIFLLPGNKLCFIDCGMTGQLDKKTTDQLIDLIAGVMKGDIDRLCRVAIELTDIDPLLTDRRDFRADLQQVTTHFQESDLRHLDIARLLSDFFGMLQRYQVHCPSDLIFLIKALTTIEGVAEQFDPEFDVLAHVEPQIREIVTKRYGFAAIRQRMEKSMAGYLDLLENMPQEIQRFLDQFRHSQFTLNLEIKRLDHLAEKMDSSSRLMGISMIIAALIVGSSILILADRISGAPGILGTLGIIGLIMAGIYSAGFVASFLWLKKRK